MADSQAQGQNGSVFISYSRKDKEFVRKLCDGLVASDVKVWVDWEGIPLSADWMDEITRAVNGADAFLVVLSPDWLASKVCADELELGLKSNKKLIPILHRDPLPGTTMHEKLAATNWVYLRAQDDFDGTLPKLIEAINTDLEWVRQHTRLLERAIEWDGKKRNSSFLLQGSDLEDGEKWMGDAAQKSNREVLPLQAEYISASRKDAIRRQRMLLTGVSLALVVSVFLGILALFQWNAAVTNEKLARDNAVLANNNAATAVANENLAIKNENARATQQVRAEDNEKLAIKNEISARAQRNTAEAKLFQSLAGKLDTSTMLALDSWMLKPSFDAEEIIRQNLSIMPVPVVQKKHKDSIVNLQISSDGRLFASASEDGIACVWVVADGQNKFCVEHDKSVQDALFTPDGQQLITASEDGSVRFWSTADGKLIKRLDFGTILWDLDISPNGIWLAIARADGFCTLINLVNVKAKTFNIKQPGPVVVVKFSPDSAWLGIGTETGEVSTLLVGSNFTSQGPNHGAEVFALAFTPDSTLIASAGADSNVRVAKTASGKQIFVLKHGDWVEDVSFSPDGKWLTSACDDNRVWIWDVATGLSKPRLHHDGYVYEAQFSPDGKWIASTGNDQTLRVWNTISGAQMLQASLPSAGVTLAFTPDNKRVIVGGLAGNLTIWDISVLSALIGYVEFPEMVRDIQIAPSGQYWLANTDDKKVWKSNLADLLSTSKGTSGQAILTADGLTYRLDVSADSAWVVASENDNRRAILVNLVTNTQVFLEHGAYVNDAAISPDLSLVATAGQDGKIILWELKNGQKKFVLENGSEAFSVDFSRDGKQLAVGLAGSVVLWDLTSRTKVADLPENNDVGQVVFSPDGSLLAVDNDQGEVEIWDATKLSLKTGPRLALKHIGKILNLAFSPDQKYLAGGGSENYVYLWDLMTGNEIARIPHTDDVNSVAFTNDGKWLLTASIKVIQIWSVKDIPIISVQNFSKEVCSKVTSNMSAIYWRQVYNNENYREICPGLPVSQN